MRFKELLKEQMEMELGRKINFNIVIQKTHFDGIIKRVTGYEILIPPTKLYYNFRNDLDIYAKKASKDTYYFYFAATGRSMIEKPQTLKDFDKNFSTLSKNTINDYIDDGYDLNKSIGIYGNVQTLDPGKYSTLKQT